MGGTRSFPEYSVIICNPARVVKRFNPKTNMWMAGGARETGRSKAVSKAMRRNIGSLRTVISGESLRPEFSEEAPGSAREGHPSRQSALDEICS